jgi:hypothetical protein
VAGSKGRIEPLQEQDRRPGNVRGPATDVLEALAQSGHEVLAALEHTRRRGDRDDGLEDLFQAVRVEGKDVWSAGERPERLLDGAGRDRTNLTEPLGEDEVGSEVGEEQPVDGVDRTEFRQARSHCRIDLGAVETGGIEEGSADAGKLAGGGWKVALVGNADEAFFETERVDDLRRAAQKRDDSHGSAIGHGRQRSWLVRVNVAA